MAHQGYTRVGQKWRRIRTFRLNTLRRLRIRLISIFSLFDKCFKSLKKSSSTGSSKRQKKNEFGSRRSLMFEGRYVSMRSNSFYAEAINDCLEFIKRNSVSVDGGVESVACGEMKGLE